MTKKSVKNIFRVLLFLGTAISLYFVPWILVKSWIMPLPDTVQEQVDAMMDYDIDGVVVYVDQAGQPPQFYAAGVKDRANKIPADPHAYFKIASISKLYVAVAITKLVHQNKLSLDQNLAHYFPELKDKIQYADRITVRNMVMHRSGIPNFTEHPGFWEQPQDKTTDVLDYVLDLPANFEPDTDNEYSNTNYLLLGRLIERTAGYSQHQFIKEQILDPLGLKNTFSSLNDIDQDQLMSGYYVGFEEDIKTNDYGSMIATAEDVGIFLRALSVGTLLTPEEQKTYTEIYEYEHGGLLPGYQSLAEYHEDIDTVVIQVMNTTDFTGYNWNLSQIFINRIVKIIERESDS
ncbi:serine hydrolase domain-containing protein [Nonlabens marinus]|uniref:D-alanyl-D-alanine carboxypeptidase n=1 Tax=Nonlabens marinus S1-08 TaxID=1454201 RepID=W8VTW8_9FLAO|nr:serine hydrolase domain-containing protein [Nonlabens marinus]BAO54068.1 D-alanyl-D-alanine carboxypeptidase [Nonlabens marinus S1-08]